MSGYAKLFSSITTSTIWGEDNATRIVWITMMAMADSTGYVGASVPGLARVANVSQAEVECALAKFLAPDPHSRNQDHEGRRIEVVDRGWSLFNYSHFRETQDPDARRDANRRNKRAQREREKLAQENADMPDNADMSAESHMSGVSAQAEAEAEADPDSDPKKDRAQPPKKSKPRAKPKRTTSRAEPRDETALQVAWRVWRELWTERYRAKYVDSGPDAKVMQALSLSALRHTKERIAETDAAGGQLLELIEAVLRHWFTAYLAEAGHKDFLVNARHALRHAERDLAKYGLPWSKVLIRAADGSFVCPYPESDTRTSWWDERIGYDFSWMRELPQAGYNDFSNELEERAKAGPMTVEWYEQRRKELGV